jgi:hypothetical protein
VSPLGPGTAPSEAVKETGPSSIEAEKVPPPLTTIESDIIKSYYALVICGKTVKVTVEE